MGTKASNSFKSKGLRVLKVAKNSPGFKAGIEPFFDFILSMTVAEKTTDFTEISSENTAESSILSFFFEKICENLQNSIEFCVFNVFSQKKRKISMIPSKNWPNADSLLGILIRIEEIDDALTKTFKILKVLPDSASSLAGFIEKEYILGMPYYKYGDIHEFLAILTMNSEDLHKEICVFNEKTQEIRFVSMKIEKKGGLGCELGFGIINQLRPCLDTVENTNEKNENIEKFAEKNCEFKEKNNRKYKEINSKMKIPPKNPFLKKIVKKPSFEKSIIEKGLFWVLL